MPKRKRTTRTRRTPDPTRDPNFEKRVSGFIKLKEIDMEKLRKAIRRSERITAEDLAVTINARDDDFPRKR